MGFPGYNAVVPPTAKSVANYLEGEGYEARRDVVYLRKPLAAEDW